MKQTLNNYKKRLVVGVACIAVGVICWNGGNRCQAQTPANSSPALQEVVKLTKAQMGDDVIVAYINNSGTTFNLSADDMLYLQGQGVSQPVMNALLHSRAATPAPVPVSYTPPAPMQQPPLPAQAKTYAPSAIANDQVPPPPPPDQEPPPGPPTQDVSPEYFHAQLAPFGTWVNVGGVEYWRPDQAVAANPDWRP
jgi:hypothetical protein